MRTAIACFAPNITLPIWSRLFKASVLPTIDACRFLVGSPIAEMRDLARAELSFAELEVRDSYVRHGEALNHLLDGLDASPGNVVLLVEDDCFVTCGTERLERIWAELPSWHVMGSRMAHRFEEGEPVRFLDTFGDGLYPNMCFAEVDALAELDFRPMAGRDVGGMVGEELHRRGVHVAAGAHLPQRRLSGYLGTDQVIPEDWAGPWLHVGEMSLQPRWKMHGEGRMVEAMAAYSVAMEDAEVARLPAAEVFHEHAWWAETYWSASNLDYLGRCKDLMRRVYA